MDVENALIGYLTEVAEVREMLDNRYGDIESGRVKLIDGEEALAHLRQGIESRRTRSA